MTFGRESSEQDSYAMMDRFIEAGGDLSTRPMSTAQASPKDRGPLAEEAAIAMISCWRRRCAFPMGDEAQ